jgi:hypothetical protein
LISRSARYPSFRPQCRRLLHSIASGTPRVNASSKANTCSAIEGPCAPRVLVKITSLATSSGTRATYSTPALGDWIHRSRGAAATSSAVGNP